MKGKQSVVFENAPYVESYSSLAGPKEGEGPMGYRLEEWSEDPMFGGKTWDEAESKMQAATFSRLLRKTNFTESDIDYVFAGDLLGQLIGTGFGVGSFGIPLFGLYGACSTMGESISLASMCVAAGFANRAVAVASSHFASAEKQFRFPLEYGNQRPLSASWTVTGCGCVMIGKNPSLIRVKAVTTGKIVDYGVKDSMNMGACMAPAAAELIYANFMDLNVAPDYYDKIITGDLGSVGKVLLIELLKEKGFDISSNYMDCGIEIYSEEKQDTHAGGSGCGCSAVVLCNYIFPMLEKGKWKRVLFVPTGAMFSPVSFNEGKSVPGIAHGVVFESEVM